MIRKGNRDNIRIIFRFFNPRPKRNGELYMYEYPSFVRPSVSPSVRPSIRPSVCLSEQTNGHLLGRHELGTNNLFHIGVHGHSATMPI